MSYTSIIFLYFFLPAFMGLYAIVKAPHRPFIMSLGSGFVIAWASPWALIPVAATVLLTYFTGIICFNRKQKGQSADGVMVFFTLVILAQALFFFAFHGFGGTLTSVVGLGVITLNSLSYITDIYREGIDPETRFFTVLAYVCFLPSLAGIPFVRYETIRKDLEGPHLRSDLIADGILLMLIGISEKVIVSDRLLQLFSDIHTTSSSGLSALLSWMSAFIFGAAMYLKLKGLSHIARGFGMMLGFEIKPSFDYPYSRHTVTDYIKSWNIPAFEFGKVYLYNPLTAHEKSKGFGLFAAAMTVTVICLSYSITVNYLLWGLMAAAAVMLEMHFGARLAKVPKAVRYILTHAMIMIGWMLISQPTPESALDHILHMFTGGMLLDSKPLLYFLGTAMPYFLLIIIFEMPFVNSIINKLIERKSRFISAARPFLIFTLLILCTSFMMTGGLNAGEVLR